MTQLHVIGAHAFRENRRNRRKACAPDNCVIDYSYIFIKPMQEFYLLEFVSHRRETQLLDKNNLNV